MNPCSSIATDAYPNSLRLYLGSLLSRISVQVIRKEKNMHFIKCTFNLKCHSYTEVFLLPYHIAFNPVIHVTYLRIMFDADKNSPYLHKTTLKTMSTVPHHVFRDNNIKFFDLILFLYFHTTFLYYLYL